MKRINVLAIRRKLNLSQAEMGQKIGVDQSTIHRWETKKRNPRGPARKLLEQLAKAAP